VVVLPVPLWSLQRYLAQEKLLGTPAAAHIFCDPHAAAFKALGFTLKFDSRAKFTSIHAKTSVASATWKGFVLGVTGGGMQGDPRQQGGAFVIDGAAAAGPTCVWSHWDRHNADQVPIPVLLEAAGVPQSHYTHRGVKASADTAQPAPSAMGLDTAAAGAGGGDTAAAAAAATTSN
jgi:hypothetical protein